MSNDARINTNELESPLMITKFSSTFKPHQLIIGGGPTLGFNFRLEGSENLKIYGFTIWALIGPVCNNHLANLSNTPFSALLSSSEFNKASITYVTTP